jgi:hypothetical protein
MKFNKIIALACTLSAVHPAFAGNKDRSGQAAGTQLLVNPWASTNGVFGLNGAHSGGLQAMKLNVAGLTRTKNLEVGATHNTYLSGSGSTIIGAGFANRVNEKGVLGVHVMSINMGEVPVTTVDAPQGGLGTFRPSIFNASLGYGHSFTKSIDAGVNFTFLSEGVSNVRAGAFAIDAGIQYRTGDKEELHFGVFLKNVGSNMRFAGDGLAFNGTSPDDPGKQITLQNRSEKFQLPTQLVIASSYDLYFGNDVKMEAAAPPAEGEAPAPETATLTGIKNSRLTLMGSFISNSFIADNLGLGAEYAYREAFHLRAGYRYESGIADVATSQTFYKGLSAGAGFAFKFGKTSNQKVQVDYAFRPTSVGSVHAVSLLFKN